MGDYRRILGYVDFLSYVNLLPSEINQIIISEVTALKCFEKMTLVKKSKRKDGVGCLIKGPYMFSQG